MDNDCDTLTDNDIPGTGVLCDGGDTDLCEEDTVECVFDGSDFVVECQDTTGSDVDNTCNGVDEDCDSATDEADDGYTTPRSNRRTAGRASANATGKF